MPYTWLTCCVVHVCRGVVQAAKDYNVVAYPFYGYWEDIGTIKSFFEENLKLCRHVSSSSTSRGTIDTY